MAEKDIERLLVREVKKMGGEVYKWTSPGNRGVPDRIVILPDHTVTFVELKVQKGYESPLQKEQKKRLQKVGATVETLYGQDQVDDFLRRCKRRLCNL